LTRENENNWLPRAYLALIGLAGAGVLLNLTLSLLAEGRPPRAFAEAGLFVLFAILAGSSPVQLPRTPIVSVAFAVDYACLLIYGPAVASWVGVISFAFLLRRSARLRVFFNQGQLVLSLGLAWLTYRWAGGSFIWEGPIPRAVAFDRMVPALVLCGLSYFLVSSFCIATAVGLHTRRPVLGLWVVSFRWMAIQFLALAPFGVLMAMVYQIPELRILAVALFLLPLFGARYVFRGAMEMLEVHRQTVQAFSNALEAFDAYTRNHSELVTRYADLIGRQLGLSEAQLEALTFAARVHDIGKCRFDWDPIIAKPGKPTDAEWQIIRQHPTAGSELAAAIEFLPHSAGIVAGIVRHHHERLDGSGYPDGLKGEEIGRAARILCVADAFEAMTARRAYQRPRSHEEAIAELRRCAGTQFDPAAVEALAAVQARGELSFAAAPAPEALSPSTP
jgi:HD-GYP domain-containing protein (c-di-GMP phosphodiesterase class II)